jgi:hypothetical protein
MRNFGLSFMGGVHQVLVNTEKHVEFGLPRPSEPLLDWFTLDQAFDNEEPDIFRALRWDYGLVDRLYGRQEDLRAIILWAEGGANTATARLVTGEGGSGKTRLAAEAATQLRKKGWTAGFLPRNGSCLFDVSEKGCS